MNFGQFLLIIAHIQTSD